METEPSSLNLVTDIEEYLEEFFGSMRDSRITFIQVVNLFNGRIELNDSAIRLQFDNLLEEFAQALESHGFMFFSPGKSPQRVLGNTIQYLTHSKHDRMELIGVVGLWRHVGYREVLNIVKKAIILISKHYAKLDKSN